MSSITQILDDGLAMLIGRGQSPARYVVAFSGGIDSTVLLHALCRSSASVPVVAVHIDHQLCEESAEWERHCRAFAESLGIEYIVRQADIAADCGQGPEAAARAARYGLFETLMEENDWLLSAHHESDQAETLLLNLFRGSGPAGLSAIGRSRPFAKGRLVRPLLGVRKAQIEAYADQENLSWIEDPSNLQSRFDRNFLRNEIVPELETRWPALTGRLTRSAELAGEASDLLDDLAQVDLATAGVIDRLEITALQQLSPARQRNLLRYAIRSLGLPPPPATRLAQIVDELMSARDDAQPLVKWPGSEARRYRDKIYLLAAEEPNATGCPAEPLREGVRVQLGSALGSLSLARSGQAGVAASVIETGLTVRFRAGGECIRPVGREYTHKLKKLLQDAAVVPWMRTRIPLLYTTDKLVAVADLWIAEEFSDESGFQIHWNNHPPIT